MTLKDSKKGNKFRITNIREKNLDSRLLSLGVCRGDTCTVENVANGNVLVKTSETKLVISLNLANKIDIEMEWKNDKYSLYRKSKCWKVGFN